MRRGEPRRSMRYDRESVYRAHVALMLEVYEVYGHVPSIGMYAAYMCSRCVIYKLQRNWCIRRSCTLTTTCEARAVINGLHIQTLSIILPTHRKNPYSEATVKNLADCC
ncbi:hypothetical protein EVAR_23892_1 [Eumeta japonica]|uniref:Uncharacterized protein n=1 Tax=Eumeta variegata TaxID=151549 RepID=A0A4C1V4H2_EUMVA|nr:hypothetical protein EVAR_23892_1 [Eumeta japonica]